MFSSPVRKNSNVPECRPTDIRSLARAAGRWMSPIAVSTRFMFHAACTACRAWSGAGEEDEQRVAGELDDVAAVVGDRQQHGEDARERRDELLGALATGRGELLGERREARDVDDDGGAVDAQVRIGVVGDAVEEARAQRRCRDEATHRSPSQRRPATAAGSRRSTGLLQGRLTGDSAVVRNIPRSAGECHPFAQRKLCGPSAAGARHRAGASPTLNT